MSLITPEVLHRLAAIVGTDYLATTPEIITENSQDALKQVFPAEAVVFPRTAEEIAAIMRLANEHKFYVTARGGGVVTRAASAGWRALRASGSISERRANHRYSERSGALIARCGALNSHGVVVAVSC